MTVRIDARTPTPHPTTAVLDSLFFLGVMLAIAWLLLWSRRAERRSIGGRDTSPFAVRSPEDYRQKYGDVQPF